jgi:hypothetical protein
VRNSNFRIFNNPVTNYEVKNSNFRIFNNPVKNQAIKVQNVPRPAAAKPPDPGFAGVMPTSSACRARVETGA